MEWLIQAALLATDRGPLELARLAAVAPADYDAVRFVLHPTLRLFESPYPALAIWEANTGSESLPDVIDLDGGGDRLAIMRRRMQLQFLQLSVSEHGFLGALDGGAPFSEAVAIGEERGSGFDAAAALQRFVAAEAIVDVAAADT